MARKAKKKIHQMPPLSFVDKLIYWTVMALQVVFFLALMFGALLLREKIAFSDETVVAASEHISLWWMIVPSFSLLIVVIPWGRWYQDRRPLFGRRNFKYGPPAWPRVYPLFMKNKPPVWVSERKKKEKNELLLFYWWYCCSASSRIHGRYTAGTVCEMTVASCSIICSTDKFGNSDPGRLPKSRSGRSNTIPAANIIGSRAGALKWCSKPTAERSIVLTAANFDLTGKPKSNIGSAGCSKSKAAVTPN